MEEQERAARAETDAASSKLCPECGIEMIHSDNSGWWCEVCSAVEDGLHFFWKEIREAQFSDYKDVPGDLDPLIDVALKNAARQAVRAFLDTAIEYNMRKAAQEERVVQLAQQFFDAMVGRQVLPTGKGAGEEIFYDESWLVGAIFAWLHFEIQAPENPADLDKLAQEVQQEFMEIVLAIP